MAGVPTSTSGDNLRTDVIQLETIKPRNMKSDPFAHVQYNYTPCSIEPDEPVVTATISFSL